MVDTVRETRLVEKFNWISLRGLGELTLEPGDQESLIIEASVSTLSAIVSEVKEGKLVIRFKGHRIPNRVGPIRIYVTYREMSGIEVSGTAAVKGENLATDSFNLLINGAAKVTLDLDADTIVTRVSGAGWVKLAGFAERHTLSISGTGNFHGSRLSCQECQVSISGAGRAVVNAKQKLDAKIGGAGSIRYMGNPIIARRVSGVGNISPFKQ